MIRLMVEPLTAERFAPFGAVFAPRDEPGRTYVEAALVNARTAAAPSLSMTTKADTVRLPHTISQMERHALSSQSFVPLGDVEMLTIVAPHGADGGPAMEEARAFRSSGQTGLTYGADVWHHPLTLLAGAPARFAVFMWLDGGPLDEEFVDIAPAMVCAP